MSSRLDLIVFQLGNAKHIFVLLLTNIFKDKITFHMFYVQNSTNVAGFDMLRGAYC